MVRGRYCRGLQSFCINDYGTTIKVKFKNEKQEEIGSRKLCCSDAAHWEGCTKFHRFVCAKISRYMFGAKDLQFRPSSVYNSVGIPNLISDTFSKRFRGVLADGDNAGTDLERHSVARYALRAV